MAAPLTRGAQVAALPWRDVCGLWKDYTTATADCLAAAAGDDSAAAGRRLTRLLFEAGERCTESDGSPALMSSSIPANYSRSTFSFVQAMVNPCFFSAAHMSS
jgi:hypothetical protein